MSRRWILAAGGAALVMAAAASGAPAAKPVNQTPPKIGGSPIVGRTLTADPGKWQGTDLTYAYQWRRCDQENCSNIAGATAQKYVAVSQDEGGTLRVRVTATGGGESATVDSAATGLVQPATGSKPVNTKAPAIGGRAAVGETLTAATGTWTGEEPITYAYQWRKCDGAGNACSDVGGATKSTYTVPSSAAGKTLRVEVTAKNNRGHATAMSGATPQIAGEAPPPDANGIVNLPNGGKSVDAKDVPKDQRLVVDSVKFSPNPVTSRSTAITVTIVVKDTRGYFVRNAFVFFRSTPILTETPTDAKTATDGHIVYSVMPRGDFPLKNGYNVQFYVKAYRSGDTTLGGIYGSRLVQVATASS